MDKLFLWEWKKTKKLTLCFTCLIFLFIMFMIINVETNRISWTDSNGKSLSGKAAVEAKIATVSKIEGKVAPEKLINCVNEYKKVYKKGKIEDTKEYGKYIEPYQDYIYRMILRIYDDGNSAFDQVLINLSDNQLNNFYSNWSKAAIRESGVNKNSKLHTTLENKAKKVDKPFIYEYNDGLYYLILQFKDIIMWVFIIIAIALSSIFSKDDLRGLEEVSMSTKYGREKLTVGKLKYGIFLSIIIYILSLLVINIVVGSIYTFKGGNTSIQLVYSRTLWNTSIGKGYLLLILLGLLATITTALFVMYISVKSRKSKLSLLLSIGLTFIPNIFLTNIKNTFLTPILGIIPVNLIDSSMVFGSNIFYELGSFQFSYLIISVILSVVMIFVTIKGIKKEVMNYKL
ncbi:ABC transporter permease subunit [Anaerosalibacter massiliensis]|uniref:ABC transporter permease subunit n=1 Tax=Anaerosalibacter massiliensis TaxID=1347392 RepID=UPI0005B2A50F|nr:ABC transporter permease subunit [Anaerosalibacter massiliensis]